MDKSIVRAGRRLGGHQYVPIIHHWLPDGYAPLVLSLMRLRVVEIIYKGSYRLPDLVHGLYHCSTPHQMVVPYAVRCRDGVFAVAHNTQFRAEDDFLVRVFTDSVDLQ